VLSAAALGGAEESESSDEDREKQSE